MREGVLKGQKFKGKYEVLNCRISRSVWGESLDKISSMWEVWIFFWNYTINNLLCSSEKKPIIVYVIASPLTALKVLSLASEKFLSSNLEFCHTTGIT